MIVHADCREHMATMDANSVDAIVTDPPYGLSFMGKGWDKGVPGVEFWQAAIRVLKPGAYLLAFGGTRTFHRMAVAIEDAGFEIRDTLSWLYGQGFPKSHDVGKAIDKLNGRRFEDRYALGRHIRERREALGYSRLQVNTWFGYADGCEHWERQDPHGARVPTLADWNILHDRLGLSDEWLPLIERVEAEREVTGPKSGSYGYQPNGERWAKEHAPTAPATDAAKQWDGWGTALKPAWEPVIVARKPLEGTVAANVLTHGTGAINVDACRIEGGMDDTPESWAKKGAGGKAGANGFAGQFSQGMKDAYARGDIPLPSGRWPANVVLDDEAAALLDAQSGERKAGVYKAPTARKRNNGLGLGTTDTRNGTSNAPDNYGDTGGASRFFYTAKASRSERNAGCEGMPERVSGGMAGTADQTLLTGSGNIRNNLSTNPHPTVKPISLMRWLVRLVTPPGGVVLDPFAGSFTTGVACILEGFDFIGIEQEEEYVTIGRARMEHFRRHGENWKTAKSAAIPLACGTADTSQSSLTAGSLPQQMRILERGECDEQAS